MAASWASIVESVHRFKRIPYLSCFCQGMLLRKVENSRLLTREKHSFAPLYFQFCTSTYTPPPPSLIMLVRTRVAIIKTGTKSTAPVPLSLLQNQRWCWLAHNNGCCLTGLETWLTANWMTRVTCLGWRVSRRHLPWILHRRVSCDRFLRHLSGATVMQDLNIS